MKDHQTAVVSRRGFLGGMIAGAATLAHDGPVRGHWTPPALSWEEWSALDALGIADLVRRGELSAVEAADQMVHAVHGLDARLNAVVEVYYDKLEPGGSDGLPKGIFHGVPYLFKDVGAVEKGRISEWGSRGTLGRVVERDEPYIIKLRRSGLNFLGRAAAPEQGTSPVTESLMNGFTHNPWDLRRTPGGSSGGAGAAVAAGILPMAAANDGGGSTRIPASLCGNVGLKHSRRIANAFAGSQDSYSLTSAGVNTRSVRDTAAFLDAILDPDRTNANPGGDGSYLAALSEPTNPLRIAVSSGKWGPYQADADALREMERIAEALRELGHTVGPADPDIDFRDYFKAFKIFWTAPTRARMTPQQLERLAGCIPERDLSSVEPVTRMIYESGKSWTREDFLWALEINAALTRSVDSFFEQWDLLLTPTVAQHTPELGSSLALSYGHQSIDEWWFNVFGFIPYTPLANFTGHPAISLPLARFDSGMPLGAHFMGPNESERSMLQLAAQLEQAMRWFDVHPPVHVTTL